MDFSRLIDAGVAGGIGLDSFIVGKGILPELLGFLDNVKRPLLVFDNNTYAVCGERVEHLLSTRAFSTHVFFRDGVLIPDETAVEELEADLLPDTDLIIGVGSGVINDICKFVSYRRNIEYVIAATAPSMDGYVSSGAAMIWKGMKETFTTHTPKAVIADTEILSNAPMDMIRSGYGDIIGKYSALCDWKLSALVNGEHFDEAIYAYTYDMLEKTIPLAKKLLSRDEESVGTLTEALIGVGVAMACLGNSRPASGSEHHISHFFEITGIINGTPYLPHGTDVAFATWMTAKMRERIVEEKEFKPCPMQSWDAYESEIKRVYGSVADGVISLQKRVGRYGRYDETNRVYVEKWQEIREVLKEMPKAPEIRSLLDDIGLDVNEIYSAYPVSHIKDAYSYAKDLKDRYTVLWLYNSLYGDELVGDIPSCI